MLSHGNAKRTQASHLELRGEPAERIVERYEQLQVADHRFFTTLRAGPVDLQALWILMANLRAGISHDFVVWISMTIARVEDRRIGSLLAKQLDDELGHGEFGQIHTVLLDRFISALEPWRLHGREDAVLAPGQKLAREVGKLFASDEPYEGVGALIVGEIFAEKMDHCLGDEARRASDLDEEALRWLTLHERLEVQHAGDSSELTHLIPQEGPALAATWRGAIRQWELLWEFLDGVHALAAARST